MTEESILSPREKEILSLFARLQTLAQGFSTKSRSELSIDAAGTDLPISVLSVAQAFSRAFNLSDRDLALLRDISLSIRKAPQLKSIAELLVNEEYVAETYRDMMSKRAALEPDYKTPCNIERLLSLGSEAIRYRSSRTYSPCRISVFPSDKPKVKQVDRALNGYLPTEAEHVYVKKDPPTRSIKRLAKCSAVIIYTRDPEKAHLLEELANSDRDLRGLKMAFSCPPSELFTRLLSLDTGFSIDSDSLPEINLLKNLPKEYRATIKTSLSFFSNIVFGENALVVIGPAVSLYAIVGRTRTLGLSSSSSISFKSAKDISITAQNKVTAKLSLSLIYAVRDMIGHTARITEQCFGESEKKLSIERIYENQSKDTAVYCATVDLSSSPAPYHETLYASLGLITRAAADGFKLSDSRLTFSSHLSLSLNSETDIGDAVAAILGLYRVETEFAVLDDAPTVEHSESGSVITLYLKAYSTKRDREDPKLSSVAPLIFADLDENGLPALDAIKKFALGELRPEIIEESEA